MFRRIGFPLVVFGPDGVAGGGAAPSGGGETPASSSGAASTPSGPSSSGGATSSDAGVGSSASPTTSPASPSTPEPIASSFEGMDFSDIDDDSMEGLNPSPAPAPAVAAPVVPVAPAAPVVPAPAAATPAVAAPAQPGVVAPAPAAGPQEAPAFVPTPAEPGKIAEQFLANEAAFVDHLAATDFKLSEADAQALETDAVGFIPKLLSRMYVRSQAAALNQMQRVVPAMLQNQMRIMQRNSVNENKFYTRWPSIDRATHAETVGRLARTYRQMNPAASLDQMVEDLGPIVMMTAKIAPGAAPNGHAPGVAAQTRPSPSQSPFRPAGTSAGGGAPQPGTDQNPWGGLSGATDDDE